MYTNGNAVIKLLFVCFCLIILAKTSDSRKRLRLFKVIYYYDKTLDSMSDSRKGSLTESLSSNADLYHKQLNTSTNEEKQRQKFIDTKAPFKRR